MSRLSKMIEKLFPSRKTRKVLDQSVALDRLSEISDIFRNLGKQMWLTDGTLLGFHREGKFLGHDLDIDVGCMIDEYDESINKAFFANKWTLKRTLGDIDCGYEQTWRKGEVYLDIFYFYNDGDRLWHGAWQRNKETKKRNLIKYYYEPFGFKQREFMGRVFPIPDNEEWYITQKYGEDWRIPRSKWDWAFDPSNAVRTDIWK
ncbi:MAG TPA: hypothetical protein PLE74_04070 [Candidatus Cloacimonadota bacterium]|nr:hypothetical protein [Candidatus Cloacimonadota bacterium]HPT71437.1 hypothetical protein [Candidatus Cloacimonadota bacterium]